MVNSNLSAILAFMGEHWFLTWCLAWPLYFVICGILKAPVVIYSRTLRFLMVRKYGWPTMPNMDADGDIVHPKPEENPKGGAQR